MNERTEYLIKEMGWIANDLALKALNDFVAACHDADGNIIAPDRKAVISARAFLPERLPMSIVRKKQRA